MILILYNCVVLLDYTIQHKKMLQLRHPKSPKQPWQFITIYIYIILFIYIYIIIYSIYVYLPTKLAHLWGTLHTLW